MSQLSEEQVKALKAASDLHDGSLAERINNNIRYGVSGALVGIALGVVIASLFGGSRIMFGAIGGVGGMAIAISSKRFLKNINS